MLTKEVFFYGVRPCVSLSVCVSVSPQILKNYQSEKLCNELQQTILIIMAGLVLSVTRILRAA